MSTANEQMAGREVVKVSDCRKFREPQLSAAEIIIHSFFLFTTRGGRDEFRHITATPSYG